MPRPTPSADDEQARDFDPTRSMELLWQGQGGDAGAVNELFARYIPRLRQVVAAKVAPWQRAAVDPDDVLQETLIVATRRLNELEVRTSASILQWLTRIAEFEIKNRLEYLRAEKRDPALEQGLAGGQDEHEGAGVVVPSRDPSPSQECVRSEMEQLIERERRQLEPPDYREVIRLRRSGAGWEHIRTALGGASIAAVQELHQRAWKRLRERLARFRG